MPEYTNHLKHESSPYLLQHAHNPVEWYAWGETALKKARDEGKLLLISVGYAACHWCHVMAHKCFENEEIAQFMNAHFVNIKVDREERPDIDKIYMNAVMLINRTGGWPLNAFALPDGRPFFGGTYFPPERWLDLLKGIIHTYQESPERIKEYADQIQNGIRQTERIFSKTKNVELKQDTIDGFAETLKGDIDRSKGGTKGAPKFPMPSIWHFLLKYYFYNKDKEAMKMAFNTLEKMASGGIYDHIGGGFARYSVDSDWRIPHFEKMLYDNGQLLSLYAEAYKISGNIRFRQLLKETTAFLRQELLAEHGAFYASLDADSEGEEGRFYVWSAKEIDDALGEDAPLFKQYYSVNGKGSWEGNNVLQIADEATSIILESGLSRQNFATKMEQCRKKLFQERNKRQRPATDYKVLTSWNALVISGLVDVYNALEDENVFVMANNAADFITETMFVHGELYRNYNGKKPEIPGFLDDYALFIKALTKLYQAGFDESRILLAKRLTEIVFERFYDSESGMFFYTQAYQNNLIERKMELSDNVIPSSNAVMAENLIALGKLFYMDDWLEQAQQMVVNVEKYMQKTPAFYPAWGMQFLQLVNPLWEVALTGSNLHQVCSKVSRNYLPNYVIAATEAYKSELPVLQDKENPESGFRIYPCQNKVCDMPLTDADALIKKLSR